MPLDRIKRLWTHRYYKYTHIVEAHMWGCLACFYFLGKKLFKLKGRPLIAIIRTEHFGDIVAAEPIARHVRELHPDAYIVWFVKPAFRELVDFNPSINEVFPEYCVTQRQVLKSTGVFDRGFELQFRNNNECAKCQVFTDNATAVDRNINVDNYLEYGNLLSVFAKSGGLIPTNSGFPSDDNPRLFLQPKHEERVSQLGLKRTYIAIHCQSNYAPKDWPAERWNALIAWILKNYDMDVVEVGLKSNLSVDADRYHNLCGKLSIMETGAVIKNAGLFIGLDSGPSHLANASGVSGIVLMGSLGNFPSYNPYSGKYGREENVVLVRKPGVPCSGLSIAYVMEKCKPVLDRL